LRGEGRGRRGRNDPNNVGTCEYMYKGKKGTTEKKKQVGF
jgi:hypothetical protein